MKVELLYFRGCENAGPARVLLSSCLALLGVQVSVVERVGDFPSPTVLVNGLDVMGRQVGPGRICRLDLPTEEKILAALESARNRE